MNNQRDIYNIEGNDFNMSNPNEEKEIDKDKDQRKIIERVKLSKWSTCCCFLCARKFNNMQNILLDEGMRIIMEKLDIRFLFKRILRDEKIQENYDFKDERINMSDECKQKLQKMYSSYYGLI